MNDEIIRKMPVSLIAEQSLLGSVLIDPDGKIVSHNPSQSDLDNYFGH